MGIFWVGIFRVGVFLIPILHFERDFPEWHSNKNQKVIFFRCNNISSRWFFSFFIIIFRNGFTQTEKKYVEVIEVDICNRKIEFKAKSEIMERNRNYIKVDQKIWRVLKSKEIVALCDFLYRVWFVQFSFWKFVFADN